MRPDHGGRLELKLTQASDTTACYALSIFTPECELTAQVNVDAASSALEWDQWQGGTPPDWLQAFAKALLRTALRNKQSDGEWPRRLTRWRPAPKA